MFPAMIESGYPRSSSAALVAAGGALGPIIPPSIVMIIYGTTMNVDVPSMFSGAVIPGILIAVMMIVTNRLLANRWDVKLSQEKYSS